METPRTAATNVRKISLWRVPFADAGVPSVIVRADSKAEAALFASAFADYHGRDGSGDVARVEQYDGAVRDGHAWFERDDRPRADAGGLRRDVPMLVALGAVWLVVGLAIVAALRWLAGALL